MARTPSNMLPLGTPAPDFALRNVDGRIVSRKDFSSAPGLMVMFICNHCPFVKHLREALVAYANDFLPRGLGIVAISSNDVVAYPDDSFEKMIEEARTFGYRFPYLLDESQDVAKAFRAACTPDFYLFNAEHRLVYRGQFDDSRPGNGVPVSGADLRAATEALLAGRQPSEAQKASLGCNIKWKPGFEPEYFLKPMPKA